MIDRTLSLHHVTWVVADLESAIAALAPLVADIVREPLPQRGAATARVRLGEAWLVLVQPLGPGVPAERLAEAGEGPLLLSFRVASLEAALQALAARGVAAAGPPRAGLANWRVVDLAAALPGGVNLQLCEEPVGDG